MESRTLKYVAEAGGAELISGQPEACVANVCTDSRRVREGDLFVALRGEKHDAHDYLPEVFSKASAVVVERGREPSPAPGSGCAVLAVDDTRKMLGRLAAAYRRDFDVPIVAVGGSNGKTTTKELLASMLRQVMPTLWSEESFNNDIGVPLTLMRLDAGHRAAVLEVGTNHPGEIEPLVRMASPRMGIITNIGREHLEHFGDLEGVLKEEGWLAELLPSGGVLFLNGDAETADRLAGRSQARVVRVGLGRANEWRVSRVRLDKGGATFRMTGPMESCNGEYRLNLLGKHQVWNAALAIAVAGNLGLKYADMARGLGSCTPPRMRMEYWEAHGIRVLDDAYNANTDSMIAALDTLCELPFQGRRVAVLGDMAEQGTQSALAHAEVGRHAALLGIGQLFAVGRMAADTAQAARAAGLGRVMEFSDVESAVAAVRGFLKPGDVVLLKASRAARLERIAESLRTGRN